MTNDDCWLLAVIVVECEAAAWRVDEGARARARPARARGQGRTRAARATVYMADDKGKQQERASDDGAVRRLSSKIN